MVVPPILGEDSAIPSLQINVCPGQTEGGGGGGFSVWALQTLISVLSRKEGRKKEKEKIQQMNSNIFPCNIV